MGPNEWLNNYDMDAMMYLFREKISLRRWKPNRVAFMNCMFSNQIITAYGKFDGNKRGYKVDNNLLEYGRGELPYHGSTCSVWSVDVDRLYIPICVNQIHWISMCVNLVNRTVEVFDCGGKKNNRAVEAFAVLIPRIAKAVQSSDKKKDFNVKQYTVSYVPMRALNKSGNYYGAYSLRFIECHLLGLDFSLVNDENIQEARHKIAFDLWEAANDEALQYRMSTFKPPKRAPEKTTPRAFQAEKYIEAEYKEVLGDPLFAQVMAIFVHKLKYSGRVIHSFVCKQLLTAKRHELCTQIISAYGKFDGNRRGYKLDNTMLEYGRGELPYHGSTGSVWSFDVDRLYIPAFVNQNHWISMCANLVNRTVEVFDCGGRKNNRSVEASTILIPRIVKAVQSSDKKKDFNVKQYTVSYVPMRGLNTSGNDCGAYSLKFIECHLLGLDFSLVNDENIQEARHKIAYDLWEAANDEVLQYRMSTFKPRRKPSNSFEFIIVVFDIFQFIILIYTLLLLL
ncbi:hypothetical protein DY000_02041271 [Brassica cretica]|uniref:Ubiquitin-like protease family profile domain-containing protein n=1 Tax=Brassica cretica TaxID=69181 RepID=A0ABQ7B925_BRACR|nr:hypothetical protein DY000_02041271 [Brassica cretica]